MTQLEVLHRDQHYLVVNKPSGLLTTTTTDDEDCLVKRVERLDPGAERSHPTSRLDREVSGLVVFARTRRATQCVVEARRQHTYARRYVGLVAGCPSPRQGLVEGTIGLDPNDSRHRIANAGLAAQSARTRYETAIAAELASRVHLFPETGRTHQLRVHMASHGNSLLGDVHYGGSRRMALLNGRMLSLRRVMLHCREVTIPHPEGSRVTIEAPFPSDFLGVLQALGLAMPSGG